MSQEIRVKVTRNGARKYLTMYYDDPVTGKREQRSTKETTKKAALKVAGKWEAELNAGTYSRDTRITWDDFRDRYEAECLGQHSRHAVAVWGSAANHLESIIAPKLLANVTTDALARLQATLRARMKEVPGETPDAPARKVRAVSDVSIATHLRHLKAALNWAVRMKLLAKAPHIEMPRIARSGMMRGRPITTEEFERMLAAVPKVRPNDSDKWVRYLRGLWLSGLRLDESTRVSWDQDAPFCLDLSGTHPRFRIFAESHKGRRDEVIPVTPEFEEFVLATPESERHGPLFPMGVEPNRAGRIVSKIGKKAGVVVDKAANQYATAHDLRRSFGTRLARTEPPAVVKMMMRHASIDTTMKHYISLDADEIANQWWRSRQTDDSVRTSVRTQQKTPDTSSGDSSQVQL